MAQDKFSEAQARLESQLGEPVLQAVGMSAGGQGLLSFSRSDSPFWRPYLTVNGKKHTRVPRAMFLILTPTRVIITGLHKYAPQVDAPILTLQRGDAEIIAGQAQRGTWTFNFRSRSSGAELDLELGRSGGIAAELAEQLREFSVTPSTPDGTSKVGYNRRSALRRFRRLNTFIGIAVLALSLGAFGIGAYSYYAYRSGTPTKATVVSCSKTRSGRTCRATWTINGQTQRGRINATSDDNQRVGSSVDVHVFKGKAYATQWDKWYFIGGGIFGAAGLFVLLFPLYRKEG